MTSPSTVLVVDDDASMRSLFDIYIQSFGYEVLLAGGGQEALQVAAATQRIEVVLMDVVMPGMSARDLSDKLRACLPAVRILYCSGHPANSLTNSGLELSDANLVQKPCAPTDLKRKLEELIVVRRGG